MLREGWLPSLPLLTKDLLEQAAQRKTYIYRAFFAAALYGVGLWFYSTSLAEGVASLGRGAEVLSKLKWLQIGITLAIVPLQAYGALAAEKERGTLELLLLTKLSLREIVLEKFAAHFVPIAALQLLALPLMAIAYPMGGVELADVIGTFVQLLCTTAIAVGWAILCSSWSYTTQGALLLYLSLAPFGIVAAIPGGPLQRMLLPVVALYGCLLFTMGLIVAARLMEEISDIRDASREPERPEPEVPTKADARRARWGLVAVVFTQPLVMLSFFLVHFLPRLATGLGWILGTSLVLPVFWMMAATLLIVRSRRPVAREPSAVLAAIDVAVHAVNDLAVKGILLPSKTGTLLCDQPVAWREVQQPAFRWRTLVWGVTVLESVLALVVLWGRGSIRVRDEFALVWLVLEVVLWVVAVGTLTLHAASLFPLEQVHQTLDVLLATPLPKREIVAQKMAGAGRMILAWSIPLATMWLVRIVFLDAPVPSPPGTSAWSAWANNGMSLLAVLLFPSFVVWLGMLCGLLLKSRVQGLLTAMSVLAVVCLSPWLLLWLHRADLFVVCPLTPLSPLEMLPGSRLPSFATVSAIRVGLLILALLGLRFTVHRQFSRRVGRLEAASSARC